MSAHTKRRPRVHSGRVKKINQYLSEQEAAQMQQMQEQVEASMAQQQLNEGQIAEENQGIGQQMMNYPSQEELKEGENADGIAGSQEEPEFGHGHGHQQDDGEEQ